MAKQRVLAGLIDAAIVLGWIVVVLGAASLFAIRGPGLRTAALSLWWHGAVSLAIVLPVSLAAAVFEAGRRHATPGKRACRLIVGGESRHALPTPGRVIVRNLLKYALSLVLIQTAALAVTGSAGAAEPSVWALVALAAGVPVGFVVGLFLGDGATLYDVVSGTRVAEASGRRVAAGVVADGPIVPARRAL